MRTSQTVPSLQFHVQSGKVGPGSPVRMPPNKRRDQNDLTAPSVTAHVKRQDGRLQAYGWSLPSRNQTAASSTAPATPSKGGGGGGGAVAVPVPVYCRPLEDQEPGMKIWCAAGIDLTGGQTKDGGSLVGSGSSVFYRSGEDPVVEPAEDAVQTLAAELAQSRKELLEAESFEKRLSSIVWIISSASDAKGRSRVNVIDSNRPGDVILTFDIHGSNVLCIASVAGVKDSDFGPPPEAPPRQEEPRPQGEESPDESSSSGIRYVSCSVAGTDPVVGRDDHDPPTEVFQPALSKRTVEPVDVSTPTEGSESVATNTSVFRQSWNKPPWSDVIKDGLSEPSKSPPNGPSLFVCPTPFDFLFSSAADFTSASTALATVWLGCQCGRLYVHSAVLHWKKALRVVKLPDAVLAIIHVRGRVMAALANGQVAVFARDSNGEWDLTSYWLLELAPPTVAVRCLTRVHSNVWAAFRNRIAVIDPETLQVRSTFEAHPRRESQIRQLCWTGDGVWVSIRLDSSIRLFSAHGEHRHLQDVDVEPYVSKMLGTGKLGFSFVRITAMMVSMHRLWMGTGNGVIISVPLSETSSSAPLAVAAPKEDGEGGEAVGGLAVYSDAKGDKVVPGSFIPYCSMAQAQLSFHGHKDAVKFFVAVPGQGGASAASVESAQQSENHVQQQEMTSGSGPSSMLVLSGGEGYVDFRQGKIRSFLSFGGSSHDALLGHPPGHFFCRAGRDAGDGEPFDRLASGPARPSPTVITRHHARHS